ncbi:MAG TPA: MerR family transcriptional regulator [Pseudonocardia sp.]|nr:MerR family transcriptional regulator [Pseudonocardia sp.]
MPPRERRPRLLLTSELAEELGVSARLIQQYRHDGILTPTMETPKGHARWDLEDVRKQLRALREKNG